MKAYNDDKCFYELKKLNKTLKSMTTEIATLNDILADIAENQAVMNETTSNNDTFDVSEWIYECR